MNQQEIYLFQQTVKTNMATKLNADQIVQLPKFVYSDYLNKLKILASSQINRNPENLIRQTPKLHRYSQSSAKLSSMDIPQKINRSPSFYYIQNMEIASMKQFILILNQANIKKEKLERRKSRFRQKLFTRQVERKIQSSQNTRNLRLTTISAQKINKRLKQKEAKVYFQIN